MPVPPFVASTLLARIREALPPADVHRLGDALVRRHRRHLLDLARLHARILVDDPARRLDGARARRLAVRTVRAWARDYRTDDAVRDALGDIAHALHETRERMPETRGSIDHERLAGTLAREIADAFVEATGLPARDPALPVIVRVVADGLAPGTGRARLTRALERAITEIEARNAVQAAEIGGERPTRRRTDRALLDA